VKRLKPKRGSKAWKRTRRSPPPPGCASAHVIPTRYALEKDADGFTEVQPRYTIGYHERAEHRHA
jgi:hypothetical protein